MNDMERCHCKSDLNALAVHATPGWRPNDGVTPRGFGLVEFRDAYGQDCSLQESSVMPHVWLGVGGCRMHLSVDQVEGLVAALSNWLDERPFMDAEDAESAPAGRGAGTR